MASAPTRKPRKVWNATRDVRKSLVAKDLVELLNKGRAKLGLSVSEEVTLVLEEDGTEVDEEEYFELLPSNTVFIILKRGQQWSDASSASSSATREVVESQADGVTEVDSAGSAISPKLIELTRRIQRDIGMIITLSNTELQMIAECDTNTLAGLVNNEEEFASALQNACHRYLDDRQSATEAVELLKLYHRSRMNKDNKTESMQT